MTSANSPPNGEEASKDDEEEGEEDEPKVMTYEDLREMREEILKNLT